MATSSQQAGRLIRQMRQDKGWNHEDMSDEILRRYGMKFAVSPRTIWRVEGGHRPTVRKGFGIAMVLDTVPSKLWDDAPGRKRKVAA